MKRAAVKSNEYGARGMISNECVMGSPGPAGYGLRTPVVCM